MIKGRIFGKCYYYILNNYYTYVNVEDAKMCILFILKYVYTATYLSRAQVASWGFHLQLRSPAVVQFVVK